MEKWKSEINMNYSSVVLLFKGEVLNFWSGHLDAKRCNFYNLLQHIFSFMANKIIQMFLSIPLCHSMQFQVYSLKPEYHRAVFSLF